jgi:hypothetical protein
MLLWGIGYATQDTLLKAIIAESLNRNESPQQVGDAIQAKDTEKFTVAYKQMLDSCYACHLAAGKPYLRLRIPEQPAAPIINYEPQP